MHEPTEDEQIWEAVTAADPTFAERFERYEEKRREIDEALAPVREDLVLHGFRVAAIADLKLEDAPLKAAAPLLIKWLPIVTFRPAKCVIIDVLHDRRAGVDAARALVSEFRRVAADDELDPMISIRAHLGSALRASATDAVADELLSIAADRSQGAHRALVVLALGGLKKNRAAAIDVLRSQLADAEVRVPAIDALGKLRASDTHDEIERFREDQSPAVRAAARRALKKSGS
ncbi:MAG: hypothetical protein Q7V88_06390 [Actinomycetota bacterium]|nr:hypothetical protein [Actinomycetota bacterium]